MIGINYFGQGGELRGCVNDVNNIKSLIKSRGFTEDQYHMLILTDDQEDSSHQPTHRNIIEAMYWLVIGAQPNDSLLIHYAGHGGQKKDYDGDELDGSDEIIYPLDFESAGIIVDDEMNSILVQQLPRGARFEYIFTPPKIDVYGQLYIPKMWHSSLNLNFYVEFGNMIHFAVSAWTSEMPPGIDTPFCPSSTGPIIYI